ncbi:mitochondrial genome maintenance protein Mgm101p [Diutina catenulata]
MLARQLARTSRVLSSPVRFQFSRGVVYSRVGSNKSSATVATPPMATATEPSEPVAASKTNTFNDSPVPLGQPEGASTNWSESFHGLGSQPFPREVIDILMAPIAGGDIEIKPDGLLYLPEIKYRRILNRAFGPGGWGLAPRTESYVTPKQISREYALICHGRLVSIARGEQDYFGGEEKLTTALEGCKSNALMRCCKDLGIASELWDPSFIRDWKKKYCDEVFVEHATTKKKRKIWKLKSVKSLDYPYKLV